MNIPLCISADDPESHLPWNSQRSITKFAGRGDLDWSLDVITKRRKSQVDPRSHKRHTHMHTKPIGQLGHTEDIGSVPLITRYISYKEHVCAQGMTEIKTKQGSHHSSFGNVFKKGVVPE